MKPQLFTSTVMLILSVISTAHADEPIDGSRGYCVPQGAELRVENAVVVIKGGVANGTTFISSPRNHKFFAVGSTDRLEGADWGGRFLLAKTGEVNGNVITAVFESHTNSLKAERQIVICVAEGAPVIQSYKVIGSASVNTCDVHGGAPSARSRAGTQAMRSAEQHCAIIGTGNARPTGLRVLSESRGSCWAGSNSSATVELAYQCQ